MKTNILAIADALSDQDLLARIPVLAGREYEAAAELVGHLAALDALLTTARLSSRCGPRSSLEPYTVKR